MYFCCGAVVILASIWLFIGNFINYRLLARERKLAEQYKRTETEDPDQVRFRKEEDGEAQASDGAANEGQKDEEAMQRETNIWEPRRSLSFSDCATLPNGDQTCVWRHLLVPQQAVFRVLCISNKPTSEADVVLLTALIGMCLSKIFVTITGSVR